MITENLKQNQTMKANMIDGLFSLRGWEKKAYKILDKNRNKKMVYQALLERNPDKAQQYLLFLGKNPYSFYVKWDDQLNRFVDASFC